MAKPSLEERVKKDPKLLARVLKNPGLRSKLPAKYLTSKQQQTRKTNVRLKQPIVPGSTTTERDLARESQAAMDVKYGGLERQQKTGLAEEQTRARDVGGFYDQYLQQVAQHARNVQGIGAAAAQTGLGLQQGVTGLSAANLTQLQNPAVADAQARGAQAGDLSQMASNAAAVRQALVGSFVGQQAGQNAAAQGYADTQAHVVAPGQKLGAQAMAQGRVRQAGEKIEATKAERGASDYGYRADRRTEESKNLLAQKIAGINEADKLADNETAAARVTETERHNKATETAAQKAARLKRESADATPNKYGVSAGEWRSMSTSARQKVIRDFGAKSKTADGKGGKGPDWVTKSQSGTAMTQLTGLKQAATNAKTGLKFEPTGKEKGPDPKARLTREQAKAKILGYGPIAGKLKHPALVDAAVDAVYDHFISATTVRALITAGYKPSEVAKTLGVPTSGQVGPSKTQKGSGAPGSGRAS